MAGALGNGGAGRRRLAPRNAPVMLIADDEAQIRAVVTEMAERMGWEAVCASDGGEALDLLERHGERISFMLIDLNMPIMDGLAMLDAARFAHPQIPAILTTGQPVELVLPLAAQHGAVAVLPKPFGYRELRSLLGEPEEAPALESLHELALG